jgi:hypothetical protein
MARSALIGLRQIDGWPFGIVAMSLPKKNSETNAREMSGRKGPAYPYYSWAASLKLAEAVKALGGDREAVMKGDIAHHLGVSEESQSLSQTIASAKTYGMIEGHGEYMLTEAGRHYFYPEDESDKRRAELAFINSPPVHESLIKRFDGNVLPLPRNLGTILRSLGVPVSWLDRSASQFKEACERLELIDPGGHLRYGFAVRCSGRAKEANPELSAQMTGEPSNRVEHDQPKHPATSPPSTTVHSASQSRNSETLTVWTDPSPSGTVRVETPNPLPRALWERLKRYVEILEPSKGEEGP